MAATGISEWMPVIQTMSGAVLAGSVAIGVSWLNHHFARLREERATAERQRHEERVAEGKNEKELLFIATELVFLLEQFAEGCATVATDQGYQNLQRITVPESSTPTLDYSVISGDWRVLPLKLLYRIRALSVMQGEADRAIEAAEYYPPDYDEFFDARQYQYTRLGLNAIIQARRLRRYAKLPNTRLDASDWSAQTVLWKKWRSVRKRHHAQAVMFRQSLASFHMMNQIGQNNINPTPPQSAEDAGD